MFAWLYYASAWIYKEYPDYEYAQYDKLYISMFVFIFGAFTAVQSTSLGPDMNKAKRAAIKIFSIIDRPSAIDVMG